MKNCNENPQPPDAASPVSDGCHGHTGPRTPEGKSVSSGNALKHGCRSAKTVLRHEDPAEFEALVAGWFDEYQPANPLATTLVEQTARAHWFLKRASRRLEEVEWELPSNAWHWTDTHQKLFANFSRYKTAAERAFLRFFGQLEAHVKKVQKDEDHRRHALERAAKIEIRWINRTAEGFPAELKATQWIEVEKLDGECRTTFYPTNEKLEADTAARPDEVFFVQRWFNFPFGVPPEYSWMAPDRIQKATCARGYQTFCYSDWLKVIEQEKETGTPHAGPIRFLFFDLEPETHLPGSNG